MEFAANNSGDIMVYITRSNFSHLRVSHDTIGKGLAMENQENELYLHS